MIDYPVTYERDINRSYMKMSAIEKSSLDERIILSRGFPGVLPVEKCYVNGAGQYWYNISGKQALDTYCKVKDLNEGFFEQLILQICKLVECLEWNLVDTSCLVLDPELIFVNHNGESISFVLYPDGKRAFKEELQRLMEYLLTKLNHANPQEVHKVYDIYHMVLSEGYGIVDLKSAILSRRELEVVEKEEKIQVEIPYEESVVEEKEDLVSQIEKKIEGLLTRAKLLLLGVREKREEIPMVVYPEDEIEEQEVAQNPTICLSSGQGEARGMLLYEGAGNYPDFKLEQNICMLGKNPRVRLYINRETISQFHAKFEYIDQKYYIEDMNSTNGTFVNDKMLNYKEQRQLCPGDILRFADVKYRFL